MPFCLRTLSYLSCSRSGELVSSPVLSHRSLPSGSRFELSGAWRKRLTSQWTKAIVSVALLCAVLAVLAANYDLSIILVNIHELPFSVAIGALAALLANGLIATVRFKVIACDMGYPISFRQSLKAVGAGSLAGAVFFQLAGQLIARGVIMGGTGIAFAKVAVITIYERIAAAVLSALAALAGAYFIFGKIYLDPSSGGLKIICALVGTAAAGAYLGYGRMGAEAIAPYLTRHFGIQLLKALLLTAGVQAPMMGAYVLVAHSLAPAVNISDVIAASLIVMFAASVPISLAGWGMREMSAVTALSTIGVPAHIGFTTAVLVGFGSLLAMGVILAFSITPWPPKANGGAAALS